MWNIPSMEELSQEMSKIKMTTQETAPAYAPSAEDVANAFVEQYYDALNKSPGILQHFYQDSSLLSRPDKNGNLKTVTALQAINDNIFSFDYEDYRAEAKTVDAQESYGNGVIVLITGGLTRRDKNVTRKFTQTFFLAPQEEGYFVLNDVFRFVGENEPTPNTYASANGISENAPPTALTAESDWDDVVEFQPGQLPYFEPPPISTGSGLLPRATEENITGATLSGTGIPNQYSYSLSQAIEENIIGATPSGIVRPLPYNIRGVALIPQATEENITGAVLSGLATRISNQYRYSLYPASEENITGATLSGTVRPLPYNIGRAALIPQATEENITGATLSGLATGISNQYGYSLSPAIEENIIGATPSGTARPLPYNMRGAALLSHAIEENITGVALSGIVTGISNQYSYSLSSATEKNITGATPSGIVKPLPYNIRRVALIPQATEENITGAALSGLATGISNQYSYSLPLATEKNIIGATPSGTARPLLYNIRGAALHSQATEENITGAALSSLATTISNQYSYSLSPAAEENITGATPSGPARPGAGWV